MYIQLQSYDLDLDPMTLILDLDLDLLKMYLLGKMKFLCQGIQKLEPEQDIHGETRMRPKALGLPRRIQGW